MDDREISELLDTIMRGNRTTLSAILYGFDRIPPRGQEILFTMLERLREPHTEQRLLIHTRRASGPFELVIVHATWKPFWSADGFLPFILGRHGSRLQVLGYVLPFNPVWEILTEEDQKYVFSLASFWADWLEVNKSA